MNLSFTRNALSRFPELKSDKVDSKLWAELIRVAKDNDDKLQSDINKIANRNTTGRGIDMAELCPDWQNISDHTSYFVKALQEYDTIFLPDGSTWYVADLVVPTGKSIIGNATVSNDPTTINDIKPCIKKAAGAVTSILNLSLSKRVNLRGFRIDGVTSDKYGILATQADNVFTTDLTGHRCLTFYGSPSSSAASAYTSIHWGNYVRDCVYGYENLQDSSVYGGTCHGCTYGVYNDQASSAFNRYLTRFEWCIEYNVYNKLGSNNYFDVQSDAGRAGGFYLENCNRNTINGFFRRSGRRDNSTSAHIYLKGVKETCIFMNTVTGDNDSGTPPTTPKYAVIFDGTDSSLVNRNIYIDGNLNGYTVSPVKYLGEHPINVTISGIGYTTEGTGAQPSNTPRNQDLGSAAFMDWKVITAGSRPIAYLNNADMNSTSDQLFTWVNNYTPQKYIIDSVVAHSPSLALSTAVGGIFTNPAKAATTVVGVAQAYTSLSVSTNYSKLTLDTPVQQTYLTADTLYLTLSTPQGAASTATFVVMGTILG